MALEIEGKLIQKLEMQSGQGKNGTWQKQEFIIETQEQYPKKVCVSLWGDKTELLSQLALNDQVRVAINIESREYNGRWYTDIRAWKLEKLGAGMSSSNVPEYSATDIPAEDDDDDLPF